MPYNKRDKVRESVTAGIRTIQYYHFKFDSEKHRVNSMLNSLCIDLIANLPKQEFLTYDNTGKRTRTFINKFKFELLRRVAHEIEAGKRERVKKWRRSLTKKKKTVDIVRRQA